MVLVLLCYTLLAWRWPTSDVLNIILLAPVQKRPSSIQLSYHLPISVRWPVLPGSLSRYLLLTTSRCCRSSAHSSRRHSYRSGEPEPAPEPEPEEVNSVRSADYQKVSAFYILKFYLNKPFYFKKFGVLHLQHEKTKFVDGNFKHLFGKQKSS